MSDKRANCIIYTSDGEMRAVNLDPPGIPNSEAAVVPVYFDLDGNAYGATQYKVNLSADGTQALLPEPEPSGKVFWVFYEFMYGGDK